MVQWREDFNMENKMENVPKRKRRSYTGTLVKLIVYNSGILRFLLLLLLFVINLYKYQQSLIYTFKFSFSLYSVFEFWRESQWKILGLLQFKKKFHSPTDFLNKNGGGDTFQKHLKCNEKNENYKMDAKIHLNWTFIIDKNIQLNLFYTSIIV